MHGKTCERFLNGSAADLCAFDLLELDGKDLRREPLEVRKATLASLLRGCRSGLQFNQHLEHPGDIVCAHACAMGLEGIVSKRLGSRYVSGRTKDWLKLKNPNAPAVKLYLDGVDVTGTVTNRTVTNTTQPLYLAVGAGFLKGTLDEASLYNRELSATTIAAHYAAR